MSESDGVGRDKIRPDKMRPNKIRVLCVDDHEMVQEAICVN